MYSEDGPFLSGMPVPPRRSWTGSSGSSRPGAPISQFFLNTNRSTRRVSIRF